MWLPFMAFGWRAYELRLALLYIDDLLRLQGDEPSRAKGIRSRMARPRSGC